MDKQLLGIDAGGTFTDFVLLSQVGGELRLQTHKVLSTPAAPEQAILQGIAELGLERAVQQGRLHIVHGSTVATNAALENKGVRTALITNRGFADLLTLARQTRPSLYQLESPPRIPPVPQALCLETGGRLAADGSELEALTAADLAQLQEQLRSLQPAAVAINLLFSFIDEGNERRIENALQDLPMFVCRSSEVLPEYREYERGIATWLNASLGPVVNGYLQRLQQALGNSALQIMQSSGETFSAAVASRRAVNLLLSGPAAGLAAIHHLGQLLNEPEVISFDMGGTSTDVALLRGAPEITNEGKVAGYPVAVPMVDMHTIGAGGGSLASVDVGGMLRVGPESAGADPGPACYGRGGTQATVTDANLVLGRLQPDLTEASHLRLDLSLAQQAVERLARSLHMDVADTALGIIRIANEHMVAALRLISVQRGYDPADFLLASFGGAGGLHVCALADAMGMRRALVPANAGVLSALGMLVAPRGRQFSRTVRVNLARAGNTDIEAVYSELYNFGVGQLQAEGLEATELVAERSADLCYQGQSFTLTVPWHNLEQLQQDFQQRHEERYGFVHNSAVELVNLRLKLTSRRAPPTLPQQPVMPGNQASRQAAVHGIPEPVPVLRRSALEVGRQITGPAIITEFSATTFLPAHWAARSDNFGNLLLHLR